MATSIATQPTNRSLPRSILLGTGAGLVGGAVFGMMMGMMNMLPMVAMLVKSDNPVVGFIVHMLISAAIGASFGAIMAVLPAQGRIGTIIAGTIYGAIWWVLGALILMPLMLGMSEMVLKVGDMQWTSLMGHVIFGAVTGLVYSLLNNRA
jgi:uncharacterized membrane protein YagU involved in acid resistance